MTTIDETLERLRERALWHFPDHHCIVEVDPLDLRALLDDHARLRGELLRVRIDDKVCSGFGGDPDEAAALADKGREAFLSYRLAVKCREHRINNARLRAENDALRGLAREVVDISLCVDDQGAAADPVAHAKYGHGDGTVGCLHCEARAMLAKADGGDAQEAADPVRAGMTIGLMELDGTYRIRFVEGDRETLVDTGLAVTWSGVSMKGIDGKIVVTTEHGSAVVERPARAALGEAGQP